MSEIGTALLGLLETMHVFNGSLQNLILILKNTIFMWNLQVHLILYFAKLNCKLNIFLCVIYCKLLYCTFLHWVTMVTRYALF